MFSSICKVSSPFKWDEEPKHLACQPAAKLVPNTSKKTRHKGKKICTEREKPRIEVSVGETEGALFRRKGECRAGARCWIVFLKKRG